MRPPFPLKERHVRRAHGKKALLSVKRLLRYAASALRRSAVSCPAARRAAAAPCAGVRVPARRTRRGGPYRAALPKRRALEPARANALYHRVCFLPTAAALASAHALLSPPCRTASRYSDPVSCLAQHTPGARSDAGKSVLGGRLAFPLRSRPLRLRTKTGLQPADVSASRTCRATVSAAEAVSCGYIGRLMISPQIFSVTGRRAPAPSAR